MADLGTLKSSEQRDRGFTLTEVVVSCVLLMIISGTALEIFSAGFRHAKESRERCIAYNLGRERLEYNFSAFPAPGSVVNESYGTIAGFGNYSRVTTVSSFDPANYSGELVLINVTVFWDGGNRSQSFMTLKANFTG